MLAYRSLKLSPQPQALNSWFLFDLLSNWVIKRQYENHMYNAHWVFFSYINTMGESQCRDTGPTSGLLWSLPGTLGKFASTWIIFEESDQNRNMECQSLASPGLGCPRFSVQSNFHSLSILHFVSLFSSKSPQNGKACALCDQSCKLAHFKNGIDKLPQI